MTRWNVISFLMGVFVAMLHRGTKFMRIARQTAPGLAVALGFLIQPGQLFAQATFEGDYQGYTWTKLFALYPTWGGMDLEFLPDGRMLLAEARGLVRMFSADGIYLSDVIDLQSEVCTTGDTGMFSVLVDPEFPQQPWIYLAYAVDTDPANPDTTLQRFVRVIRVQLDPSTNYQTALPDTRQSLIGATWGQAILSDGIFHSNGCMQWGTDGTLLMTMGDSHKVLVYTPSQSISYDEGRIPASVNIGPLRAQTLDNGSGKALRIDRQTGRGLPSNPFWNGDPDAWQSKIWATGLRMPWRFSVQRTTGSHDPAEGRPGRLWIGDVGEDSFDELNITAPGGGDNFGWPFWEGYVHPASVYEMDVYNGPAPYVPFEATSKGLMGSHEPESLPHYPDEILGNLGRPLLCITGGLHYDWPQFEGVGKPAPYSAILNGKYLFADWGGAQTNCLYSAELDENGLVKSVVRAADGPYSPVENPSLGLTEFAVNPANGKIYVSTWWDVRRLDFSSLGAPPTPRFTMDKESGALPLTVHFDASATDDPAGEAIARYDWQVDSVQEASRSTPDFEFTFPENRNYEVALTAYDDSGLSSTLTKVVYAGNEAPHAKILTPEPWGKYPSDGSPIQLSYSGEASDPDGSVDDIRWNLALGHNEHRHDIQKTTGVLQGEFEISKPDEANTWYILELFVTDDRGMTVMDSTTVHEEGTGPYPYGLVESWLLH